jgi:hypothetical protein
VVAATALIQPNRANPLGVLSIIFLVAFASFAVFQPFLANCPSFKEAAQPVNNQLVNQPITSVSIVAVPNCSLYSFCFCGGSSLNISCLFSSLVLKLR